MVCEETFFLSLVVDASIYIEKDSESLLDKITSFLIKFVEVLLHVGKQ